MDSVRESCQSAGEVIPEPENERRADGREQIQELSQVGSRCGQDGVDGVANQPLQKAAAHAVILFEVAELGFQRTASATPLDLISRQITRVSPAYTTRKVA